MSNNMIEAGGNGRYGRSFDLLREVGFRDVLRYDHIRKFGTNPALSTSPEDVWDQGGVYTFPSDKTMGKELLKAIKSARD